MVFLKRGISKNEKGINEFGKRGGKEMPAKCKKPLEQKCNKVERKRWEEMSTNFRVRVQKMES